MWTYAPDLDERTPNILLTGSVNVVPTNAGGFRNAYTTVEADNGTNQPTYPAVGAAVLGARYLLRDDGSDRLFAGTATKIYEANQTVAYAWTDVARGGNYSGATQWMFDQYGATSLAAISAGTRTEIQASTGTVGTAFANLGGAPKAYIIVVQDNAIYAFNYDATGTAVPDGWIRSDTGGITTWTTGTGECVAGRFTETPGDITAAIKLGPGVVVFKDRGMWRGQYVGLPEVVRWELVSPSVGCFGALAVVNVDDVLYFADANGFWRYDGSRPQRVSDGLNTELRVYWLANSATPPLIQIGIDDISNLLYIHNGSAYYAYNYVTGAWGPLVTMQINTSYLSFVFRSVCNGPFNKIHSMPGMSGDLDAPNAYKFINGAGNDCDLRNFSSNVLVSGASPNNLLNYSYTIVPSFFGQNGKTSNLSRIYHDLRSYSKSTSGGGAVGATTDTVTAYRRPFSRGVQQNSGATGGYNDSYGYTDVRANGNWFKETFSQTATGTAVNDSVTLSFEWLGFEPEFASGGGKN